MKLMGQKHYDRGFKVGAEAAARDYHAALRDWTGCECGDDYDRGYKAALDAHFLARRAPKRAAMDMISGK